LELRHDVAKRWLCDEYEGCTISAQLVAFHSSPNDWACSPPARSKVPTATQLLVLAHDTLASELPNLSGFGLATKDHCVPFHCSTSVGCDTVPVRLLPTAKQLVVLAHDTPRSVPPPVSFGIVLTDQLVPSHCSTNVSEPACPVAKQVVALAHDTAVSASKPELGVGLGLATIDQLVPFHCSVKVFGGPL
jgi:hypothetical protein